MPAKQLHVAPKFGDQVKVWPDPDCKGRVLERPGRFLPIGGATVPWTEFLADRHATGEVMLHDPAPAPAPSAAVVAPEISEPPASAPMASSTASPAPSSAPSEEK